VIAFSPDSCVLFAASSDDTGGRRPAAGPASSSLAGTASPLPPAAAGFAAAEDASPLSPRKVSSLLVSSSGALRPESDMKEKEPKAIRGKKKGERGKTSLFYRILGFACSDAGRWEYGAHETGQLDPHGRASTATNLETTGDALAGDGRWWCLPGPEEEVLPSSFSSTSALLPSSDMDSASGSRLPKSEREQGRQVR